MTNWVGAESFAPNSENNSANVPTMKKRKARAAEPKTAATKKIVLDMRPGPLLCPLNCGLWWEVMFALNKVTSCHSKAMNKENGVVVASRGQCWRGFDDFATGNAPVLLENGVVLMGFGLPNRRSCPGLGTGLGWRLHG